MPKEQWIEELYRLLCTSQGEPTNDEERKNLREWAEACAAEGTGYYEDGTSPREAHDEELSCA